jgi:hypothetical protein
MARCDCPTVTLSGNHLHEEKEYAIFTQASSSSGFDGSLGPDDGSRFDQ